MYLRQAKLAYKEHVLPPHHPYVAALVQLRPSHVKQALKPVVHEVNAVFTFQYQFSNPRYDVRTEWKIFLDPEMKHIDYDIISAN